MRLTGGVSPLAEDAFDQLFRVEHVEHLSELRIHVATTSSANTRGRCPNAGQQAEALKMVAARRWTLEDVV